MNEPLGWRRFVKESTRRERLGNLATGFVVAVLAGALGPGLGWDLFPPAGFLLTRPLGLWVLGVAGALLAISRWRFLLWLGCGLACLQLLAAVSTPWPMAACRGLVRSDRLQHADAVYVLGSSIHRDGSPEATFQDRLLRGYELLGQGYAPRLLIASLKSPGQSSKSLSCLRFVRLQMAALQLKQPAEELPPMATTADEATAVAAMARRRGWRHVIIVTSPTHTRRASAVFAHAGVPVITVPSREGRFDLYSAGSALDRRVAFNTWTHETFGYLIYRLRGSI